MKQTTTLLAFFFCLVTCALNAQDLVEVQAFNYHSGTRDSLVEFPVGDHNQYEKILMYYSMRCKDGLISTGADRNLGCGEWDYSCNTYLTDSSRVDSLLTTAPTHRISGFSNNLYRYTTQETYTYYQSTQKEVVYNGVVSETEGTIGTGDIDVEYLFGGDQKESRTQMLYLASELQNQGLTAGNITGLKLGVSNPANGFDKLRIRMKHSGNPNLDRDNFDKLGLQDVYYLDTDMSGVDQFFKFHTSFDWDGSSNIIVDISFAKEGSLASSTVKASDQGLTRCLSANGTSDYSLDLFGAGKVEVDHALPTVSEEITVSFWLHGNSVMPINSTIMEASDAAGNRQVNMHVPWGNSSVFWDCGNDGTGYDRINKPADVAALKDQWNHWAFTKNAVSGEMKIYLNGALWHSGTDKFKLIDIQAFNVGAAIRSSLGYFGQLDEFRLWDKELSANNIKEWMSRSVDASHPDYANLLTYYTFDDFGSSIITDQSPNGFHGTLEQPALYRKWQGVNLEKSIVKYDERPNLTFVQGVYDLSVTDVVTLDSLVNLPNKVEEYIVVGTDLILNSTNFYYQSGEMPIYDEAGQLIGSITVAEEGSITIGELEYYNKIPSKFELLSFVTPYGINLDFGMEGKTWIFDVTDFGPVLKGKKRLTMERGGQWQEDIDIKFVFVKGTPSRDVLSLTQVWPVSSETNARIINNSRFEPRDVPTSTDATGFTLKAAITGHGQEGEFIPRFHFLTVNDFDVQQWLVWSECADNPVYPQGGTWIYDRAGWCPGAPTDVLEIDVTDQITPGEAANVEYGMQLAGGDSRYIVNVQLVSYGPPNFSLDAELLDILNPTNYVEYDRYNPMCGNPKVLIRNNGTTPLTSLDIVYDVDGGTSHSYTWEGSLDYLETAEVILPTPGISALSTPDATFNATIQNPNGSSDDYDNNNTRSAKFKIVPVLSTDIVIEMRTNAAGNETSYRLMDIDDNVIHQRTGNLGNNQTYTDTIRNLNGCYTLLVEDSDDDGIAFWANSDGSGYVQMKSAEATFFQSIATDFGRLVNYEFVADGSTAVEELPSAKSIAISPNPGANIFSVQYEGFENSTTLELHNQLGQVILQRKLTKSPRQVEIYSLDLSDLPAGVYYVKLQEGNDQLIQKLIKQ